MKQFLITLLRQSADRLSKSKENPFVAKELPLKSLSPIHDADNNGHYGDMLYWAIKNRAKEDIKNIALTGPYGSGKSSILKTFQAKYLHDSELQFLNISLATFKEEPAKAERDLEGAESSNNSSSDLLRLIELSILQQIFYRENDKTIPDSRFKRIKSLKGKEVKRLTFGLTVLLLSLTYQLWPELPNKLLKFDLPAWLDRCIHYLTLLSLIVVGFIGIRKSVRTIRGITISKLNLQNAELEIGSNVSKSILNSHLDEILYFFEATPYTVVLVEDLDRFRQTEIFTKLREINLLINNSAKIERDIVFVYAVRDDMFQDKDRTKFFDFIIPVIPVINSSNSGEVLTGIFHTGGYEIKHELVEDVSLFIDDMRLLYNITNEFYLYRENLDKQLDQNKLLAMIVYKNMFPNDFVELSNGEGELYKVFTNKTQYVEKRNLEVQDQIDALEQQNDAIESNHYNAVNDIRRIYILKFVELIGNNVFAFKRNSSQLSFEQMTEDDKFSLLQSGDELYYFFHYPGYSSPQSAKVGVKFTAVEKAVDPNFSYEDKVNQIAQRQSGTIDANNRKIVDLERDIRLSKYLKIQDLLKNDHLELDLDNQKQKQLFLILLRRGYIDENYVDYISIFYPGSITRKDRDFILNVKARIRSNFDAQLEKVDNLITKIDESEFQHEAILNVFLLSALLNGKHHEKLGSVLNLLSRGSEYSLTFIDFFVTRDEDVPLFVSKLVAIWPGIWNAITGHHFPQEKISGFFEKLMIHAEVKDLKKLDNIDKFKDFAANYPNLLQIKIPKSKFPKLMVELDIIASDVKLDAGLHNHWEFIYNNDRYAINPVMITRILQVQNKFHEEDFNTRNYYAIYQSECDKLIEYVDSEIETYVSDVFLELEHNVAEDSEHLELLLDNEDLSSDLKMQIVDKTESLVRDLDEIDDLEIVQYLFAQRKIEVSWDNVIKYYKCVESDIDATLLEYLGSKSIAKKLAAKMINTKVPVPDKVTVDAFSRALALETRLSDEIFEIFMPAIPYRYNNLAFDDLPESKVKILITHKAVGVTVANYDRARKFKMSVLLAEQTPPDFIKGISEFNIDKDILLIVSSKVFSNTQKHAIIEHIDEAILLNRPGSLSVLGGIVLRDPKFILSKPVLKGILMGTLQWREKLLLLQASFTKLEKDDIFDIMATIPYPYNELVKKGKRPTFSNDNEQLLKLLLQAGIIKNLIPSKKGLKVITHLK